MTAGRGFIGLAALIVGRWTPLGAFGAALLFSSTTAIGQSPSASARRRCSWATSSSAIPGQFYDALPYLVTIVVLAGVVGRSIPPAADGQPYERESDDLSDAGQGSRHSSADERAVARDVLDAQEGTRPGAHPGRRRRAGRAPRERGGSPSSGPRRTRRGRRTA